MNGLVRTARIANPVAALAVVGIVLVQLYLIAEYVFGDAGALSTHKTVGGFAPVVEVVVLVTALAGWWRDRMQVGLSLALLIVGVLQVSFAENLGNSPSVHALHGALALVVPLLAAQIAFRKRDLLRTRPAIAA